MMRTTATTLLLVLVVVLALDCSALRLPARVEEKDSDVPQQPSSRLSDNLDRVQAIPLADFQRMRILEEVTDDDKGTDDTTDDYYAAIDDDDDFEGSWIEKIYIQDGERYDDDQIHHYTAGTAQNMFDKSPHEWNAWEWVFFVLLLCIFGVFFSCCIMPKCCRRG